MKLLAFCRNFDKQWAPSVMRKPRGGQGGGPQHGSRGGGSGRREGGLRRGRGDAQPRGSVSPPDVASALGDKVPGKGCLVFGFPRLSALFRAFFRRSTANSRIAFFEDVHNSLQFPRNFPACFPQSRKTLGTFG